MQEKTLREFDAETFMANCKWKFEKSWYGSLNVFVWLRITRPQNAKLQLSLEIEDQRAKRVYDVDYCPQVNSHCVLLNDKVSLSGKGEIKSVVLKLHYNYCNEANIIVDDISLKAPTSAFGDRNKGRYSRNPIAMAS